MDWNNIEHPRGACMHAHLGIGPDLVKVGREMVTNCIACRARAAERQRLKPEPCERCREARR